MVQQATSAVSAQVGGALKQATQALPAAQGLIQGPAGQATETLQNAQKGVAGSLQQGIGNLAPAAGSTSQPADSGEKKGVAKSLGGLLKGSK
jgi:hypothetical protein